MKIGIAAKNRKNVETRLNSRSGYSTVKVTGYSSVAAGAGGGGGGGGWGGVADCSMALLLCWRRGAVAYVRWNLSRSQDGGNRRDHPRIAARCADSWAASSSASSSGSSAGSRPSRRPIAI